jgi:hypothetical protein
MIDRLHINLFAMRIDSYHFHHGQYLIILKKNPSSFSKYQHTYFLQHKETIGSVGDYIDISILDDRSSNFYQVVSYKPHLKMLKAV